MKSLALIPARSGSLRVKLKNVRELNGHPLLAYSIVQAQRSGLFDRIVVSTDSEKIRDIALYYGAECPFLRPQELATATSPDIEWIMHAFEHLPGAIQKYEIFAIIRPTSPFRTAETLKRAMNQLLANKNIDSLRAVELCHQHPGKMWTLSPDEIQMIPFLPQDHMQIPWHARQYQDLPKVYIQNSSLEIAWTHVLPRTRSREGKSVAPFLTQDYEGFAIDYETDWMLAELLVNKDLARLIPITTPPYPYPFV